MHRHNWARIAAVPVMLVLAAASASCGSNPTPPTTNKRMTDQGPCDLAKVKDLEQVFGSIKHAPEQEELQCFYFFENGNVAIGRRADAARHGSSFEIDGISARKFEKDSICSIDVWLVPDDINQQFGVIGNVNGRPPCDVGIEVARLILSGLPE